jgi:hypothetical protein
MILLTDASTDLKEAQAYHAAGIVSSPRSVQELAIYKQGSVVKKLLIINHVLEQVLDGRSPCMNIHLSGRPTSTLLHMRPRKMLSSKCFSLPGLPRVKQGCCTIQPQRRGGWQATATALHGEACKLLEDLLSRKPVSFLHPNLIPCLEGLVNYARASKSFRQLMWNGKSYSLLSSIFFWTR